MPIAAKPLDAMKRCRSPRCENDSIPRAETYFRAATRSHALQSAESAHAAREGSPAELDAPG